VGLEKHMSQSTTTPSLCPFHQGRGTVKTRFRGTTIRAVLLCLTIQAGLMVSGPIPSEARPLDEFLKEKNAGNYTGALDALGKTDPDPADPASIEVALFMIGELMRYPELHDRAGKVLDRIAAGIANIHPHLTGRIDQMRTAWCLSRGDIKGAEALQKSLSFLDFQAMGPFKNGCVEDFDRSYRPEQSFEHTQTCPGKLSAVTWFSVRPDRTGSISFNELFPETGHSFFYLARTIMAPQKGEYYLILGKTGYTDLWLDGTRIFSDRTGHGFCHDQYFIRVLLPAGPHRLLIKAGDSAGGIQVSMRVAAVDGTRVPAGISDAAGQPGQASLLGITFFPALAGLLNIGEPGPDELFNAGYLFLASRLGDSENNRGLRLLSAVPEGHPLYSSACRSIALAHGDIEARDRYLNRSIRADPGNIESLRELAVLKISHGFAYEAYSLIDSIKKISPHSPWRHELLARLFIKQQWHPEAMRHAAALKHTLYRSVGLSLEASMFNSESDYSRSIPDLEELIRIDSFNLSWHRDLLDCNDKIGRYDLSEQLLLRMVALYPNNSTLKLRLARVVEFGHGPVQALPFLTAAIKTAPGNGDILMHLGLIYHKIGKKELAVYHLELACRHNPGNRWLRDYLDTITGSGKKIPDRTILPLSP